MVYSCDVVAKQLNDIEILSLKICTSTLSASTSVFSVLLCYVLYCLFLHLCLLLALILSQPSTIEI